MVSGQRCYHHFVVLSGFFLTRKDSPCTYWEQCSSTGAIKELRALLKGTPVVGGQVGGLSDFVSAPHHNLAERV